MYEKARFDVCDLSFQIKDQFDLFYKKVRFFIVFTRNHVALIRHFCVLFPLVCAVLEWIV